MEPVNLKGAAASYLISRARAHGVPLGVHVDVTYECDLACVHCYLEDRKRKELSLEEYEALFDDLRALGTLYMLISGGEIFYRPDGLDIVKAARARRFDTHLITHGGHITDEVADELAEIGVRVVNMSIYSDEPTAHDTVTKVPGSWQRTVDAAKRLRARGVPVTFKFVVMDLNADKVIAMRDFAASLGCHITFDADIKGDNTGSDHLMDLGLDPDKKAAMMGCVYPNLVESDMLPVFSPDDHTCMAGNSSCYISPDGTVQPCLDWNQNAGNLRDQSFTEIWQTSPVFLSARTIRRSSFSGCSSCENFSHCSLCPARSHRETGSTTGSAPSKCRETMAKTLAFEDAKSTDAAE